MNSRPYTMSPLNRRQAIRSMVDEFCFYARNRVRFTGLRKEFGRPIGASFAALLAAREVGDFHFRDRGCLARRHVRSEVDGERTRRERKRTN